MAGADSREIEPGGGGRRGEEESEDDAGDGRNLHHASAVH